MLKVFFDNNFSWAEDFDANCSFSCSWSMMYRSVNFHEKYFRIANREVAFFSIPNLEECSKEIYEFCPILNIPFVNHIPLLITCLKRWVWHCRKKIFPGDPAFFMQQKKIAPPKFCGIPNDYWKTKGFFLEYINFHKDIIVRINDAVAAFIRAFGLFGWWPCFSQYL